MKLMHLSDLHIGLRLGETSLLDDQKYIFKNIVQIVNEKQVDGVILAGDIYDKTTPSAEAVEVYDEFVTSLKNNGKKVFIINGNHDSAERISCLSKCMASSDVYINGLFNGTLDKIECIDEYGKINIYLFPFIKASHVRNAYSLKEDEIDSVEKAYQKVLEMNPINKKERNVLVSHQFISGAEKAGSEITTIGGLDEIKASVLTDFDYVALGHIHKAQDVGTHIRYCGTPLKYDFSEVNDQKTVTIVELKEKGNVNYETIPLSPLRDVLELKGTYEEITDPTFRETVGLKYKDAYLKVILTNEDPIPNAGNMLRGYYPNIIFIIYDNKRTREESVLEEIDEAIINNPIELIKKFYKEQNNSDMNDEQLKLVQELLDEIENDR